VAYGTCIDGNTCNSWTACSGSVGNAKILPDAAWASVKFSTAELVVQPGEHSYLVRMNNYLGEHSPRWRPGGCPWPDGAGWVAGSSREAPAAHSAAIQLLAEAAGETARAAAGCGGALFDCFNSGEIQFKLVQGKPS
jgi:hypothetical protein